METSEAGRTFLAEREGRRLAAYPDPGTGGAPWTIGVGHTSASGPPIVTPGMRITRQAALAILARDLRRFEADVATAVRVPLAQHEFDALVSLAFNIGPGRFAASTLVKRLNAGDRAGAGARFGDWTRAGARVLPGLVARREAERRLFMHADYGIPGGRRAATVPPIRAAHSSFSHPAAGRDQPGQTGESIMDDSKGFFASRTVWANLIGLGAIGAGLLGMDTSHVDTSGLADAIAQIVAGASFVLSTVFRVQATKTIGG